jgi:23S rRNA (cytidine1920-2'-O)/16S rRNA (cytidine1409-2'-O)-methyltransferase
MPKVRLDVLLVGRGLAESRAQAQRLIMAGKVRSDGQVMLKPGATLQEDARLEVDHGPQFVSRGGEKLQAALAAFALDVNGRTCADVGASTGGFTDCLLQHGARRVYAIDVGQGILHWKLRQDPRVAVMERTNARYVERLPEQVNLVTIDASFISLKILLPVTKGWGMEGRAEVISLIKPQFEAGRTAVARGAGVVRDPAIHRQVLQDTLGFAQQIGYSVGGLIRSPLLGPKGNTEFLAWLIWPGTPEADIEAMIAAASPY